MNQAQMNAARDEMSSWLAHPQELGATPAALEWAGEFDLHDMHYYIFKYKIEADDDKWLLGVAGGYAGDELEHCGHVFSEMEEYLPDTAEEQAKALVEMVRSYWMQQAEEAEEHKANPGSFLSFVLLEKPEWDKQAFVQALQKEWGITDESAEDDDDNETNEDILMLNWHDAIVSVSLMPGPIPQDEVDGAAFNNYMWQEAAEQVKKQQAHLLVAVLGRKMPPIEGGELLVKLTACACQQAGAIGVYANDTVYPADYYLYFAGMLKEDLFPIFNLVWIGLYKEKNGFCAYTNGLSNFGYDEIEVLNSSAEPGELHDFLADIADYVITENVVLQDGETIGFSEEQKLPITKSRGVAVRGESLKISFAEMDKSSTTSGFACR